MGLSSVDILMKFVGPVLETDQDLHLCLCAMDVTNRAPNRLDSLIIDLILLMFDHPT